jgi:SAM-dependent methyltransferase
MPLPFAEAEFDFVFSNSVFSHLNESAHRYYIGEIARCTKPGGLLIATTLGLGKMRRMYVNGKQWPSSVLGTLDEVERRLSTGRFVFGSTHRLQDYGLAVMPNNWTKVNWLPPFEVVEIKTNFSQDVNIAVRANTN